MSKYADHCPLAGVDPAAPPLKDVPRQSVELLGLAQTTPDPPTQLRLREVLEDELCLEDASEIAISAVETVLGAEADKSFHPGSLEWKS